MDKGGEAAWREALQAKGKDWVTHQLRARPGQAGDPVFDIVFEAPFPTRAFCQQWCAEEDNKLFRVTPTKVVALLAVIAFIICISRAIGGLEAPYRPQGNAAGGGAGSHRSAANSLGDVTTTSLPSAPRTSFGSTPTSSSASSSSAASRSICSYAAYSTAECPTQK